MVRKLDPLTADFDDCSLAECQAVAASLMEGLAENRYTGAQVVERRAFLGRAEWTRLGKLRPDLVGDDRVRIPGDAELVRIRKLGFAEEPTSLAELKKIADSESVPPTQAQTALAALARRGDKEALRSLEQEEDVESLTLWLDVVREAGLARIVKMFLGPDPMQFERALQLVEQIEERAYDGMVDPTGLEIGAALHAGLLGSDVDLARLSAIVTAVPGCRTAAMARKILDHPDFVELPRMVEMRGPLMELLALIEVVDREALGNKVREASEQGNPRVQGFWLACRLDLGDEEAAERWIERLRTGDGTAFFPGYTALARTRAPAVRDFLLEQLRAKPGSIEIYQALAVFGGLPIHVGFPAPDDVAALGDERAAPILRHLREGRLEKAVLAFLDAWDFAKKPGLELAPLGGAGLPAVVARLRALASQPKPRMRHELLAALAVSGDEQARAEHMGFLDAGIRGFRERVRPLGLTLDADPKTLPLLLRGAGTDRVVPEKLLLDVYPLFGLMIDSRTLPARRLQRYDLSGDKVLPSRIARGLILGPERLVPTEGEEAGK